MRVLRRLLARLALLALVLVLGLAAPVAYIEVACRPGPAASPDPGLVAETRPAIRTLLTYPEWHIVHAYDDYAEVIRRDDPHDYAYLKAIGGYWGTLCTLMRQSAELGEIDTATRQMVHVIGVSFSFEMLMKAAYEETVGRVFTWLRGDERSALDDLSAKQAAAYATFLQQVPWYLYDFRADAAALAAASTGNLRDRERALALGAEHWARSRYAGVIEQAVAATGQDTLTLQMVVQGLPEAVLQSAPDVRILTDLPEGTMIETPRYRVLTHLLQDWAQAGANFIDIAGNDRILFTALSSAAMVDGAMLSMPRQGYDDTRHLFLVPVAELGRHLRGLQEAGLVLEHIHDY